jgi:phasin family protein
MFTAPPQFAASQKSALDNFLTLTNVCLESTKKLSDLQVTMANEFVAESVKRVESLSTLKEMPSAIALQAAAKPAVAKSVGYAKSAYGVLAAASAEINTLAEAQAAEVSKQLTDAIDKATQNAPAGTEPAVAFVKSVLSAVTTAADQLTKLTKQVIAAAEANLDAVFAALEKPVAKA